MGTDLTDGGSFAAFAGLGLLISATVLVPAYFAYRKTEKLRATGKRVRGFVVSNSFHLGRPSVWRPFVCFTTHDGWLIQAEYTRGIPWGMRRFAAGEAVGIVYDEQNPRDFLILGVWPNSALFIRFPSQLPALWNRPRNYWPYFSPWGW